MRIIHTADWHLCDTLQRVDRTGDLRARVEVVATLCEEHKADALLIAGDLFSEQASADEMTEALGHLHQTFQPFFARGGTILAVTGNHDRDARIEMIRAGMRLATVPRSAPGPLSGGRMYLQNGVSLAILATGDEQVQFALVPYPTASRYAQAGDTFRAKEEENRALHGRVAEWVKGVPSLPNFDAGLPTVLAAHLHVRGAEVHTLYNLSERDDVVFDTGFLPTSWAYIALGHVHKPQLLAGMDHVRYCGSLDRLDLGERSDEKGVVLIDVGRTGLREKPTWLPIPATPIYDVKITDPATELPSLAERYPDRETAIVRITVTDTGAGPGRDEINRELRRSFPRFSEITFLRPQRWSESPPCGLAPQADYRATVRKYLTEHEGLAADPDRDALLALAEEFLTKEEMS